MAQETKTIEEFINQKNIRGFWPYQPSGTLVKRSRDPSDTSPMVDRQREEFDTAIKFVDNLVQSRTMYITWFIAAIIGVFGNFVVSVFFTMPQFSNFRNILTLGGAFILVLLIIVGLSYIQPISFRVDFIPEYISFPKGYGRYIDETQITNPIAKIKLQFDFIDDIVTDFSRIIRLMVFRDYMNAFLDETKYIKFKHITQAGSYLPNLYITLDVTWKAKLLPIDREVIINEFLRFTGTLLNCRTTCGVFAFETDPDEWRVNGARFFNYITGWDFESGLNQILQQIKRT